MIFSKSLGPTSKHQKANKKNKNNLTLDTWLSSVGFFPFKVNKALPCCCREWWIGVWSGGGNTPSFKNHGRTCGNFQVTAQSNVIKFPVQEHLQRGGLNLDVGKFYLVFWGERWWIQFDHVSTGLKPPTICLRCCCLWIRSIEWSFRGGMDEVDLSQS